MACKAKPIWMKAAMPVVLIATTVAAGCSSPGATTSPTSTLTTTTSTSVATPTPSAAPDAASATSSTTLESEAPTTTETVFDELGSAPLGPISRYEDTGLGFSFIYPAGWRVTESAEVGRKVGGVPLKTVGAFDPTGSRKQEVLFEGVTVSAFNLGVGVNEDLEATFRNEVEDKVSLVQAGLSKVVVLEPLRDTVVGYEPGYETTFAFDDGGRRLRTRLVFVVVGDLEYQLVAQAVDASYDTVRPQLDMVVDSFRPAG
jgi:hypothetical protein